MSNALKKIWTRLRQSRTALNVVAGAVGLALSALEFRDRQWFTAAVLAWTSAAILALSISFIRPKGASHACELAGNPRTARWYQFRLSTWLVLVAILGWAMALKAYVKVVDPYSRGFYPDEIVFDFKMYVPEWNWRYFLAIALGPTSVVWPALALAAFIAWKVAWRVVERRPPPFRP